MTTPVVEVPRQRREDRGLPILGRVFEYARDPVAMMRHQYETYGPVAPFHALHNQAVMLLGPDAVEAALRNKDKAFANKPAWTRLVGPFFGGGLMLIDFDEHHVHRRIMQEAFTRDRLEGYAAHMHPAIEAGTADWDTEPGFQAYWKLKQLTLDIAADIFMGGAESTSRAEMDAVNRAFISCVQAAAGIDDHARPKSHALLAWLLRLTRSHRLGVTEHVLEWRAAERIAAGQRIEPLHGDGGARGGVVGSRLDRHDTRK